MNKRHKKCEIREEMALSRTYSSVMNHRGNCDKWHGTKCLDCFGGGLTKFTGKLLTEKDFLAEVRRHLYDDKPINKKEAWKHILQLNQAFSRVFARLPDNMIQSSGSGKNTESLYKLVQNFTKAIVKDLSIDKEEFYEEEKDRLL